MTSETAPVLNLDDEERDATLDDDELAEGERTDAAERAWEHETVDEPERDDDEPLSGEVLTEAQLFHGYRAALPDDAVQVTTPGRVYVNAVCPLCSEISRVVLDIDATLLVEDGVRTVKLKARTKPALHYCGQQSLEARDQVDGQTTLDDELDDDELDVQRVSNDDLMDEAELGADDDDELAEPPDDGHAHAIVDARIVDGTLDESALADDLVSALAEPDGSTA